MSWDEVYGLSQLRYSQMLSYAEAMMMLRRSNLINTKDKRRRGGGRQNFTFNVSDDEFKVKEKDRNFFSKIKPRKDRKKENE